MHTMKVLTDHMMGFITSCSFECITHWKYVKINAGYNTLLSFVFQLHGFYIDIFYFRKIYNNCKTHLYRLVFVLKLMLHSYNCLVPYLYYTPRLLYFLSSQIHLSDLVDSDIHFPVMMIMIFLSKNSLN